MGAEINNVIYMELNSGPKIANSTCGKTIDVETIDRDSTVYAPTQNCTVLYTYITKPDSIYTSDPICSTATARTCQQTVIIVLCYGCQQQLQ